ncbi:MAG TPA: hypothetical protein VFN96_10160, partial [Gemmatimonadales bacterium]|nr:hypothetical protein [Gemmatimonadales bacterium]
MARLSKSRFVTGWQCKKLLWWTAQEPDAVELQPDRVLQDLFDQGRLVGELARERFPGGVLVHHPHHAYAERLASTRQAMDSDAPAVFEASFEAGGVFAAVDVLLREGDTWALIEVKSSSRVKDEHVVDTAVQTWVLSQAGIPVTRVEVMHLNREHRHPGQGDLFVRADVTEAVERFLPQVPGLVEDLLAVLDGPLPERKIGAHCYEPRECPFHARCWPGDPNHIRYLYNAGPKTTASYLAAGIHSILDIPRGRKLPAAAQRQLRAIRQDSIIVEPALAQALAPFESPLGFLDFETVA